MNKTIVILNGPNLDRLGKREIAALGIGGYFAAVRYLLKL